MTAAATPFNPPRLSMFTAFRAVYAFLALQFALPAVSYMVAPALTYDTLDQVNRLLGGGAYPHDSSHLWHMLAVGNVATLAFMCALMCFDLKRYYPVLPALLFLKGFSAIYSLGRGLAGEPRVFFAIFVLDGLTCLAMWFFATRAYRTLEPAAANGAT